MRRNGKPSSRQSNRYSLARIANQSWAVMNCPYCRRPLTQIDYFGERLVGCIDCNRWGRPSDKTLVMELLEDDLEAIKASKGRDDFFID